MRRLTLQKQYSQMDYLRLMDNADTAYSRCVESGSVWGQNYWKGVYLALSKKAKQTIH